MTPVKKPRFAIWHLALWMAQCGTAVHAASGIASTTQSHAMPPSNALTAPFSDEQIAEINARSDLANTIVKIVEADARAQGATESWRMNLLNMLYAVPSDALRNIAASSTTRDQALSMAAAAIAQHSAAVKTQASGTNHGAIHASDTLPINFIGVAPPGNLAYTPQTPCRAVDTRNALGVVGTSPRDYFTNVSSGISYGGLSSCTFGNTNLEGVAAVAANITVVVASGAAGYLVVRPLNSASTSSFINWPEGGTPGLANFGILTSNIGGTTTTPTYLQALYNSSSGQTNIDPSTGLATYQGLGYELVAGANTPHVIIDYFGYFSTATTSATSLNCSDASTSVTVVAGTDSEVHAVCSGDTTMTGGACDAENGAVFNHSYIYPPGNYYSCNFGGSGTGIAHAVCCSVPAH